MLETLLGFAAGMSVLGCVTKVVMTLITRRRTPVIGVETTLAEIAQRLAHLEHAVDATAVEVERIAEGQRFTTKLLSERTPTAPANGDPHRKVITPH